MGNEILELLNSKAALKVLVSLDEAGAPHAVVKSSLQYDDGKIIYWEFMEASQANRNMTASLWFDRPAKVLIALADGRSWQIAVKPLQAVISGRQFRTQYTRAREQYAGADLATVWILDPVLVTEQTFSVRLDQETKAHPYFTHLDRLAGKNEGREHEKP